MTITLNGTSGIVNDATDLNYTGTLTGGTGVVNLGSGQVYKDASGNVGIGTSSPSRKLNISASGSACAIRIDNTVSGRTALLAYNDSQNLTLTNSSDTGYFAFINGTGAGTERARITSTGLFRNHSSEGVFRVNTSQGAGTTYELFWGGYGGSSTTAEGTNSIKIFSNGNIQNTNNSYGSLSDAKLKENIVDASPKLDKLNQVRIVNYNLKINPEQKLIGVVAQELEQLFPSMIDESPDRDAEGNDLGTTTKAVKYSVFVPMLIKAIQEQQTLITQQAAALTALTARITALEGTAA